MSRHPGLAVPVDVFWMRLRGLDADQDSSKGGAVETGCIGLH